MYEWYIINTGEVFYVGKGCGERYKSISNRNKFFLDMYHSHSCDVRILSNDLYEEDAYHLEYETIQWYKFHSEYRLTNQTDGGDGTRGFKLSEEQREKITKSIRQRCSDPEYLDKIRTLRSDPNGVYKSKDFRKKISDIVQGENNPNYGNHWTKEQKQSLSYKQKASHRYDGTKNPNSKKIRCIETGEIFDCIKDAQDKYKVKCQSSFTFALKSKNRTAAKLHWEYVHN